MMFGRSLFSERSGISSVEFALVASVFFMFIFGLIDFSRAMWEWNAAAKATHRGVRYAVVNDTISLAMRNFVSAGFASGQDIPEGTPGTEPVICVNTGCNGDPGQMDAIAFSNVVDRMNDIYDRIQAKNVVIEYHHVGIGWANNPTAPDLSPLVTVKLRDMEFEFVTPGFAGIFTISMPNFAASMTAEDQTSGS